jgi:hypothetical protein
MKRFIILLCGILVFAQEIHSQNTRLPDTLAYLQTIVANKAQYIGQPFSFLKNSLQIEIKYFSPFSGKRHKKDKETSTSFAFYIPTSQFNHYLSYPRLRVFWNPYLNATQSNQLWEINNGLWGQSIESFMLMQSFMIFKFLNKYLPSIP